MHQKSTPLQVKHQKYEPDESITVLSLHPVNLNTVRFYVESYLVLLAAEIVQGFANQSAPNPLRVAVLHLSGNKHKCH